MVYSLQIEKYVNLEATFKSHQKDRPDETFILHFFITINLSHNLFAETNLVKDLDPNTILKNATSSQKPNCATNGEPATSKSPNTSSDFITEAIIESANHFYITPFSNAPQEKVESNGITVFRPNNGITHGVRSAILTQDIIELEEKTKVIHLVMSLNVLAN